MSDRHSNPDDRSDNVERLQENIQHTIQNFREAEASMETATDEEKEQIRLKNERRKESIEAMREEVREEHAYQQRLED
ncbi:small acid-soluble spore protein Tlp [Allobacillus sp. GCM10007491]|uniref:Small, acid-soluble spore protein Tlp n=2 Tax=Allobacillus TaxID=1400133 RepID=A0A941CVW2_9BACI|nr:small acid-soluble spore protein Tlp [Allobacillus salarius]MBR7553155.1 small acid-soluble spore protein Tlp [Allobacillus saliphilus]TSJ67252.1 small acid-soluble spore protein Tlp [Allobacillus salarius]